LGGLTFVCPPGYKEELPRVANTDLMEEARVAYNTEVPNYRLRNPDAPAQAEGACCYETAVIFEVDSEELADYIERVEGYRPDPSLVPET
jgi:hypothetical protein